MPEAGSRQLEAQLERSQGAHYLAASGAWLNTEGGTRYRSLGAGAGLQWPQAAAEGRACQGRLGLEAQERALRSNPLLSGRYLGLAAQWQCTGLPGAASSATPYAPQWRVQLRTGRDQVFDVLLDGQRPGEFSGLTDPS